MSVFVWWCNGKAKSTLAELLNREQGAGWRSRVTSKIWLLSSSAADPHAWREGVFIISLRRRLKIRQTTDAIRYFAHGDGDDENLTGGGSGTLVYNDPDASKSHVKRRSASTAEGPGYLNVRCRLFNDWCDKSGTLGCTLMAISARRCS